MHTNQLSKAASPYLLQHAQNPVEWYEWGDEALNRAKTENKPIFLSIGYSSCHWCHVMAHESFSDPGIAAAMNRYFINIKVDREERPDLDELYMTAVQAMTGSGGWPMSVWLTPDLRPFFGGTYFPPQDHYGRTGFPRIIEAIATAWADRKGEIVKAADDLFSHLENTLKQEPSTEEPGPELLEKAFLHSRNGFDADYGGFGDAPKFPHAMELSFLLRYHHRKGTSQALTMVDTTLQHLANGGIFDHLGGGFHRYSTDAKWLVPHFEKMLYDQALLVRSFSEAFQVTGRELFRRAVRSTLDYVLRDLRSEEGGFFSAEDADSDGEEGLFYVWNFEEIEAILGEDTALFCTAYGISKSGNWEGKNILHIAASMGALCGQFGLNEENLIARLTSARSKLHAHRRLRNRPFRDEKILTDWNALMISACFRGHQITGQELYLDAALQALRFIEERLVIDEEIHHCFAAGRADISGFLSDYAFYIAALIDAYETTFDIAWLEKALKWSKTAEALFKDPEGGYFFTTMQNTVLIRGKNPFDNAVPSGNSVMILNQLRLFELTGIHDFHEKAWQALCAFTKSLEQYPQGYPEMLMALAFALGPARQIVLAGDMSSDNGKEMRLFLNHQFQPFSVRAFNDGDPYSQTLMPILTGKSTAHDFAVYICESRACKHPAFTKKELETMFK